MRAEEIVSRLLETEYGPPIPDTHLNAVGTSRHLNDLRRQAVATQDQLTVALQIERQLRKAGVTKDDVSYYISAEKAYPDIYKQANLPFRRAKVLPPNAIVGMELNDGRRIMFDVAAIP